MTAHQLVQFHRLAIAAFDRNEFGIETLSNLVRAIREEVARKNIREEYEAAYAAAIENEG